MADSYRVHVSLWPGQLCAIRVVTWLAERRLLPVRVLWWIGLRIASIPPRIRVD